MRSCIYCGKELGDGEQCDCPKAAARRAAKAGAQNAQNAAKDNDKKKDENTGSQNQGGYYRTGYTKNDGHVKRAWERFKTKVRLRRNSMKHAVGVHGGIRDIFSYIFRFLKSPATEIANPRNFSMWQMALIAAVQGAIIGLCVYFIGSGESRGWIRVFVDVTGLGGLNGYMRIMYAGLAILSGGAGGIMLFFARAWIFWIINKLMFRSYTGFTPLAQRLVLTNIPFTALAAIGVLFAFFSTTTLIILMLCGALSSFMLTYISLNEEWSSFSESRVMYAMMLGYFILFTFICSLLRISVIGG